MSDSTDSTERLPAAVQLQNAVKQQVKQLDSPAQQTSVRQRVVSDLAEREMKRREDLLSQALELRKTLDLELKKVKPDQVSYDEDGTEHKRFSKNVLESRKKGQEKLEKLDRLLNDVIDKPDAGTYKTLEDKMKKLG